MTNKIIGVICALDGEIAKYKTLLKGLVIEKICGYDFYVGNLFENKIVAVKCGVGKVNAGVTTMLLAEHYNPDFIFNSGIAGGIPGKVNSLETVIATSLVYSDVDFTADTGETLKFGQMQGLPFQFIPALDIVEKLKQFPINLKFGVIMTGDQFVTDDKATKEKIEKYFRDLDILACDMESCAVAHVCYLQNVPFVIVRTISDVVGGNNIIDYYKLLNTAADQSCDLVKLIIRTM